MMKRPRGSLPADLYHLNPDQWTEPYWKAAQEHRLVAPRCVSCLTFRLPPGPVCPTCRSQDVNWIELSGKGVIYTFTVVRHAPVPSLTDSVPYVIAVVSLPDAGGQRLITNIVNCDPDSDLHRAEREGRLR